MRKFIVNVNGSTYEIEVEEITGASSAQRPFTAAPPSASIATPDLETPKPVASTIAAQGQETISAPMPGSIIGVKVKVGDTIKVGDVLVILEAMKMENEIVAPKAGTIIAINVSKGSSVNTGDSLCVIG